MDCGDLERAIATFNEAIEARDRVALSFSKRGVCRLRCGDRTGAAKDFGSALDEDPRCVSALVNIGNLALEANMIEEAQARYEAALRIDERSAHAHHNLGIVYRRQGKLAESIRELRLAATLEAHPRAIIERFKRLWRRRG
jgi:tetratricopeptide (TPR) repeat protein